MFIITQLAIYTAYIPAIYCLLRDYIIPAIRTRINQWKDMGIVWETYHNRVPLLGVRFTLSSQPKKKILWKLPTKVTFFPWQGYLWVEMRSRLEEPGTSTFFFVVFIGVCCVEAQQKTSFGILATHKLKHIRREGKVRSWIPKKRWARPPVIDGIVTPIDCLINRCFTGVLTLYL